MYEKFAELLEKTNKTAYQVSKDTGIGENIFSYWKAGRSKPKGRTKMKMNKEKFLKTELGSSMKECVAAWDKWLEIGDRKAEYWCQAQWEVYQMALRQFYGIECHLTRTDEYFGIVTEDESDWLFKVER